MKKGRFLVFMVLIGLCMGCSGLPKNSRITYIATIPPLGFILKELTHGRAEIIVLLPPGASPHTFEPMPSTVLETHQATALFWISPGLDKWATQIPIQQKVEVVALLPTSDLLKNLEIDDAEHFDPHIWTDPLLVKELVPKLTAELIRLDPAGKSIYEKNSIAFIKQLERLHQRLRTMLKPVQGRPVILVHPSFQYMCHRYDLKIALVIEPIPEQEPSGADIIEIIRQARESKAKVIFTEPQISQRPAQSIAEYVNMKVGQLDPIGGGKRTSTYEDLLITNATELRDKL